MCYLKELEILKQEIKDKCTECFKCVSACPMLKEYVCSPKDFFSNDTIDKRAVFACRNCNLCTSVCDYDLPIGKYFEKSKGHYSLSNSKKLRKKYKRVITHQKIHFSKIASYSIKSVKKGELVYTFMPGCSLSSFSPDIVGKTVKVLKDTLGEVNVVQKCCGMPTKFIGDIEKHEELTKILKEDLKKLDTTHIIVACGMCKNSLSFLREFEIVSLWEILQNVEIKKISDDKVYAIHDSCANRNDDNVHKAVRQIVSKLGLNTVECEFSKRKTKCCGYGGMVNVGDKQMFSKMTFDTANTFIEDNIITYCVSCKNALEGKGKNLSYILEHLLENVVLDKRNSAIKKLINIRKTKKRIKEIR